MQITRLHIENFKRLKELDISFVDEELGRLQPLMMLLGDNGSGKTTVLQAIALVLSLATRKTLEPSTLGWPGFMSERLSSLGPTRVELEVRFEQDELAATQELYKEWAQAARPELRALYDPPGNATNVVLVYSGGGISSPQGPEALSQFLGRFFIKYMLKTHPKRRRVFQRVGDVFWFDQNRNLLSIGDEDADGIDRLRDHLIRWWSFHNSPYVNEENDYIGRLERHFAQLFSGARFGGVKPRELGEQGAAPEDFYFLIEREGVQYDLAEMSSGEQAVFPLLYEFVRQSIARSVVLIDELELHLHPPQQQALIFLLRRLGPDCQFIITSHSPYLESVTPAEEEFRLPGGTRCL